MIKLKRVVRNLQLEGGYFGGLGAEPQALENVV